MSKPMRAKMQIQSVTLNLGGYTEEIKMSAVYGGSTNDEDNSFAKTTPSGSITLGIANKELHGVYKPGGHVLRGLHAGCEDLKMRQ